MSQKWDIVVDSQNKLLDLDIRGLRKCKDLIYLLVRRTFVSRYKQTILGPAWAVIQPFFTTVVYSVFFGNIAGLGASGIPNFIFYLCGTILWNFFSQTLHDVSNTFVGNAGIMGKVYFPRLVMPITTAVSQFISFFIQFGFMLLFLAYYLIVKAGVAPNWYILMTPILLIQLAVLGMGCGIIISSLTTKYRDLTMVVSFGISLWSYACPVAYDMFSMGPLKPGSAFYSLYMLNPVTPVLNIFRYAYLGCGQVDWLYYGISWATTLAVLLIGLCLFSRVEKTFMDTV